MLKFIGILLAITASTSLGLYKSAELKKRRQLLLDFQDLLLQISTEIGYFKEPLPKIFEKLAGEEKESRMLLQTFLAIYYRSDINFSQNWENAVAEAYKAQPLTKEDKNLILKCGSFLGQSDLKGQQEHFELVHIQLCRQIEEAEETIRTKGRMYGKLGLSAGLIVAVIFI